MSVYINVKQATTTQHNEATIKKCTTQRDQEEGHNETETLKECRREQCLVTGGDKATPVVTWLTRLAPQRCAVVVLILAMMYTDQRENEATGDFGVQLIRELFSFSEQVLETTATYQICIPVIIKSKLSAEKSSYYSVQNILPFRTLHFKLVV